MIQVDFALKLAVAPRQSSFPAGTMPVLDVSLTNVSAAPVVFCAYMARHRLLSSVNGSGYEVRLFQPTAEVPVESSDFVPLGPGESLSWTLDLNQAAAEGYRLVWAGSLPSLVDVEVARPGYPQGEFDVRVHLGEYVLFSDEAPGRSGAQRRVNLLEDLVSGAVAEEVWRGDEIGTCRVQFA